MVKGRQQTRFAEVVGGNKAIKAAPEHPHARAHPEGGIDAGDGVLFGQNTEGIGALQEDLNQVGPGGDPLGQEQFKAGAPNRVGEAVVAPQGGGGLDHWDAQRTAGWNRSLRIGAIKNNRAIW